MQKRQSVVVKVKMSQKHGSSMAQSEAILKYKHSNLIKTRSVEKYCFNE